MYLANVMRGATKLAIAAFTFSATICLPSYAISSESLRLIGQTTKAVGRPLPSSDEIAGTANTLSSTKKPIFVVVAGFADGDKAIHSKRSRAFAHFASTHLQGSCEALAISPAYNSLREFRGEYGERDPLASVIRERVQRRLSPQILLSGTIRDQHGKIAMQLTIFDNNLQLEKLFDEFVSVPNDIEVEFTARLKAFASVYCTDTAIESDPPGTLMAAENLLQSIHDDSADKQLVNAQAATAAIPESKTLALMKIQAAWVVSNGAATAAIARQSLEQFPNCEPIQLLGNYILTYNSPRHTDATAINKLRARYAARPKDFATIITLLDAYRVEQVMYDYPDGQYGTMKVISGPIAHHENTARAISLGLDLITYYPEHYKSSFHLAMTLNKYSALVKGAGVWSSLTDEQKKRVSAIQKVAGRLYVRARSKHDQEAWIHEEMIGITNVIDEDMMSSFRRAAELAPHTASLYQTAYNFATPQWGGTYQDRKEIYETSIKHNPKAKWPDHLKNIWARDVNQFWRMKNPLLWVALATLALLCVVFYRFRSTNLD